MEDAEKRVHGACIGAPPKSETPNLHPQMLFAIWSVLEFNFVVGVIAIGTAVASSTVVASVIEYAIHRVIFTTLAGAIGGWAGQKIGRSFGWMLPVHQDEWLSRFEFEQAYRMQLVYSNAILLVSIVCGSLIGFSINYLTVKTTKVPVVNEHQQRTNK